MLQRLAVFNSDEVNAYGIRMPVDTLCLALEQGWLPGQPLFLSHDRHRVEGWTRALGIYLEPGLARLSGICFTPETLEESEKLKQGVYTFLGRQLAAEVLPHRDELERRLQGSVQGAQQPIYVNCAALVEDGLAVRAFADVFAASDDDGLVSLAGLQAIAPGVFERDGLLFFASDYLRRSLSRHNTLNTALLSRLHDLAQDETLTVRIRLDRDLVGLRSTYQSPLEFAYWWGPKFDSDLLSIPPGNTRHQASERQRLFSGVHWTEFWWHEQNDLKTLECEEVLDIPSLGIGRDHYGCRYAHSIVDPDGGEPNHLDGAIRLYDDEKMLARLDRNMYDAGRQTEYVKLWRVDGRISVERWKELITHYYRDNELVGEYLGGVDDSDHMQPHILEPNADPLAAYVPCNMEPGQGVRVCVSYHPRSEEAVGPVQLEAFDTFGTDEERMKFVEGDTFEVVKLLRRDGIKVTIPADIGRLVFEDTCVNLAMIRHSGEDAVAAAQRTLTAIAILCNAWVERGDDRIVTFNITISYEDRDVRFSFAGHVRDLHQFLERRGTHLPDTPGDVPAWISATYQLLSELFPKIVDIPPIDRVLRMTGILLFERKKIDRDWYMANFDEETQAPCVNFAIPRSQNDLVRLLENGQLTWCSGHVVEASTCSGCQQEYLACNCSKYLDGPVHQQMIEAPLVDFYWTNRPASGRYHIALDATDSESPEPDSPPS